MYVIEDEEEDVFVDNDNIDHYNEIVRSARLSTSSSNRLVEVRIYKIDDSIRSASNIHLNQAEDKGEEK